MDKLMPLKPRVSEKAYGQSQASNVYTFMVPGDANKLTVASAITAQFGVGVASVNMTNVKGKTQRRVRKGGRVSKGVRSNFKKAYVTIKSGESIPIFAAEEEAAKKAEEAATKAAKKEKK